MDPGLIDPRRFLLQAIELARDNVKRGGGGPFGAVIVQQGQIVGAGVNLVTSTNDPTAHAEVVAIRSACSKLAKWSLTGTQIFTTCEPCPMCLAAIHWARIDKIWFAASRADAAAIGFDDDSLYQELAKPYAARALPIEQVDVAEAHSVMQAWASDPKRVRY